MTITTIQGDTWDTVAVRAYGDALKAQLLMKENYKLLDHQIFPAGIEIYVPEISDDEINNDIPEWRK